MFLKDFATHLHLGPETRPLIIPPLTSPRQ